MLDIGDSNSFNTFFTITMVVTTREHHKNDFGYIMCNINFDPEDTAHKLYTHLTVNSKRSVITILNSNK